MNLSIEDLMPYIRAFVVGGAFCVIAQILIDKTALTPARILVSYVVCGVILGALGIYQPIIDFAGRGATVPLTGFGFLLSEGVRKAVEARGLIGIFTGGIEFAAAGITASILFGLIASLIFKSKPK